MAVLSVNAIVKRCGIHGIEDETREQFRILFLDKRNVLIADEVQGRGTVDHTPVYPREVVKRALELSATAIILVRNHPTPAQQGLEVVSSASLRVIPNVLHLFLISQWVPVDNQRACPHLSLVNKLSYIEGSKNADHTY